MANTAIGAVSFLALEAIGGSIAINYGFINATSAILLVGALIFLTGLPIAYYARPMASTSICSPAAPASATSARRSRR